MRKGFTLMELIIVVIIIAILAAIGVPQFFKVAERARASEAITTLGVIRSSQMRYAAEHGTTTGNLGDLDLDIVVSGWKFFDDPEIKELLDPMSSLGYEIITATRKSDFQNAGFGAYVLGMQVDGGITCKKAGDHDVCKMLGY